MAHKTGFTAKTLSQYIIRAGFAQSRIRKGNCFDLWSVAYVTTPAESSASGEAPVGLNATGNASHCLIGTSTHVPCMTLPLFKGPNGLPVGAQLMAARNNDRLLFEVARWVFGSAA